jgi:hypothetical protein
MSGFCFLLTASFGAPTSVSAVRGHPARSMFGNHGARMFAQDQEHFEESLRMIQREVQE